MLWRIQHFMSWALKIYIIFFLVMFWVKLEYFFKKKKKEWLKCQNPWGIQKSYTSFNLTFILLLWKYVYLFVGLCIRWCLSSMLWIEEIQIKFIIFIPHSFNFFSYYTFAVLFHCSFYPKDINSLINLFEL